MEFDAYFIWMLSLVFAAFVVDRLVRFANIALERKHEIALLKDEENNKVKLRIFHEALAYRKYLDDSKMELERELASNKLEVYSDIVSGIIGTFGKEYLRIAQMGTVELPTQMEALDKIIDTEFNNYVVLPRIGKTAKPPITHMEETTKIVCNKVIASLGDAFFQAYEAHGFSKAYVMSYTARAVAQKVIMYSQEINAKKED